MTSVRGLKVLFMCNLAPPPLSITFLFILIWITCEQNCTNLISCLELRPPCPKCASLLMLVILAFESKAAIDVCLCPLDVFPNMHLMSFTQCILCQLASCCLSPGSVVVEKLYYFDLFEEWIQWTFRGCSVLNKKLWSVH